MKAYIDYKHQIAHVEATDAIAAGWLGFWFATDHADLVKAGWRIYYQNPNRFKDELRVDVGGSDTLAQAIHEGPPCTHTCPQHPEATG